MSETNYRSIDIDFHVYQLIVLEKRGFDEAENGTVKLTDCRLFSAFLHEAKLLNLRNVAIRYLPRFRSESG